MNANGVLRRVVLSAVAASFVAGLAVGLVAPTAAAAFGAEDPEDWGASYARSMAERYGLDVEQTRLVRMVIEARDAEQVRILMRDEQRLPRSTRDALSEANLRANERIKYVLTESQRARFLADSEFAPLTGGPERASAPTGDGVPRGDSTGSEHR